MNIIILDEVKLFILKMGEENETRSYKYMKLLEEYGNHLRMPYSKYILPKIFELRVGGTNNIRLIYTFRNNSALIFYGFSKKTEKINQKEIQNILNKFNNLQI